MKTIQKIAAIFCLLAMILSMAACGTTGTPETTAAPGNNSANNENNDPTDGKKEVITITIGTSDNTISDGVHTDEYPVLQLIKDKFGIELDWVVYDQEKFALLAAGNDLPDVFTVYGAGEVVSSCIDGGQMMRLNELLESHGQNMLENAGYALEVNKDKDDGSNYFIPVAINNPSTTPDTNGWIGFRARADIYQAIGSPEIHSEDDWLNVIKQMQDYERERTGDNTIYGISNFTDWGDWPYFITYMFAQGYTNIWTGSHNANITTGEFVSNYLDEDSLWWKQMEFYNKAYKLGILDPDFCVQKYTQYEEKIKTGKVLTDCGLVTVDAAFCGENAILAYLPGEGFPCVRGVYGTPSTAGSSTAGARAINANTQYAVEIMELLNWLDSEEGQRTVKNGVPGVDWDVIDGEPQLIGGCLDAFKNGSGDSYMDSRRPTGLLSFISGSVTNGDGYPIALNTTASFRAMGTSAAEQNFAKTYGDESFTYPGQAYDKWVKEGTITTDTTDIYSKIAYICNEIETPPDWVGTVEGECSNYVMSNIHKVIMANDEETYEKEKADFIADLIDLGAEDSWNFFNERWIEATEIYNERYGN